jgi:hypothetical protein
MYVPKWQSNTIGKVQTEACGNPKLLENVEQHGNLHDVMRKNCARSSKKRRGNEEPKTWKIATRRGFKMMAKLVPDKGQPRRTPETITKPT